MSGPHIMIPNMTFKLGIFFIKKMFKFPGECVSVGWPIFKQALDVKCILIEVALYLMEQHISKGNKISREVSSLCISSFSTKSYCDKSSQS